MQKILVVCPISRDNRALESIGSPFSFIYHPFTSQKLKTLLYEQGSEAGKADDILGIIDNITDCYQKDSLAGVIASDDYPGAIMASMVAKNLKLPGPSPEAVLMCQHKYYARLAQQKHVPQAVPKFALLDPYKMDLHVVQAPLPFPFFIKPVRSFLSCYAKVVNCQEDLRLSAKEFPPVDFLKPFNQILKSFPQFPLNANYLIAEELLEGYQGTIEGYVFHGEIGFFGIVDSIFYPGTISFERFVYPTCLPKEVQDRMASIAADCMRGIGFDNGVFNIEFFYDPEKNTLHIIEINPRIASQFADLYEYVDGYNSYEVLLAIATGRKPKLKMRKGRFKLAASCVLRMFDNKMAIKIPDAESIERITETIPGVRTEIYAHQAQRLSNELQDGKSYRYCIIQIGANDAKDLECKLTKCIQALDFQFQ